MKRKKKDFSADSNDIYYYVDDEFIFKKLEQLQRGLENTPHHYEFISEIEEILSLCPRVRNDLEISYCLK